MNCGAELTESAYCPNCGCDVSVQKQAIVLSGLYYNQGLEKAEVRDLSGAIDMLRRSLKFNKLNISARNLLGLVYFEMGEVVAALSEWVISKNIQPDDNIAVEYIENLQKDANRLDVINQTIKKYNLALENCYNGNEDVAMIQLKKILAQNPKLIKGYHLLSLLYIKNGEYEKARKLLKKAVRIDKTNTTTLRFL
jgi:tetratricopeptide (TPR) repeat protein